MVAADSESANAALPRRRAAACWWGVVGDVFHLNFNIQNKSKTNFEKSCGVDEFFVPLHCQIQRRNGRGRQKKLSLWPSRKIPLGRPQNASHMATRDNKPMFN